jgi:hypothetical protein
LIERGVYEVARLMFKLQCRRCVCDDWGVSGVELPVGACYVRLVGWVKRVGERRRVCSTFLSSWCVRREGGELHDQPLSLSPAQSQLNRLFGTRNSRTLTWSAAVQLIAKEVNPYNPADLPQCEVVQNITLGQQPWTLSSNTNLCVRSTRELTVDPHPSISLTFPSFSPSTVG